MEVKESISHVLTDRDSVSLINDLKATDHLWLKESSSPTKKRDRMPLLMAVALRTEFF